MMMAEPESPADVVEAMKLGEDAATPPTSAGDGELGTDAPREPSNRLSSEMHQRRVHEVAGLEGRQHVQELSKLELKEHMHEVRAMQYDKERHNRYERSHPGIGKAGRGDQGMSSAALILGNGELGGGRMRYGHD